MSKVNQDWFGLCDYPFGLRGPGDREVVDTNMTRDTSSKLTKKQMSTLINNSPRIDTAANKKIRTARKAKFLGTVTNNTQTAESMAESMTRAEEESIIYEDKYNAARQEYLESVESQMPRAEIDEFLQIYRDNQCDPHRGRSNVNANVLSAGFIAASSYTDCMPTLAAGLVRPLSQEQQQQIAAMNLYDHGDPDIEGHMVNEFVDEFETMALSAVGMLRSRAGQWRNVRVRKLFAEQYNLCKARQAPVDPMSPITGVDHMMLGSYSSQQPNNSEGFVTANVSSPLIEEEVQEIDADEL